MVIKLMILVMILVPVIKLGDHHGGGDILDVTIMVIMIVLVVVMVMVIVAIVVVIIMMIVFVVIMVMVIVVMIKVVEPCGLHPLVLSPSSASRCAVPLPNRPLIETMMMTMMAMMMMMMMLFTSLGVL